MVNVPRSPALAVCAVATVAVSMVFTSAPALAAKAPVRTTIAAHLDPVTAVVRSTAVVSGTVTPAGPSLVLQRLVGHSWVTLARQKPSAAGRFAFHVRTPKAAVRWDLRVSRPASKTTRAGAGAILELHVVGTAYAVAAVPVTASVTAPALVAVTGAVLPMARGSVRLQQLTAGTWVTVATGALSSRSTFSFATAQSPGRHHLRVFRPYTGTVAAGVSGAFDVTVQPAAAAPMITTAALPQARVGRLYFVPLIAAGGTGPYTWTAAGLPAGLAVSAAGALSGTPIAKGVVSITARVTDALGHQAGTTLSLVIAPPEGYLVAWGFGTSGALGNGTLADVATPVPVSGMSSVVSVVGGNGWSLALAGDGTVWAWGNNDWGQLGNGTTTTTTTPSQVAGLSGIVAISAGNFHGLALRADGTVWAWGLNTFGQVGDGTTKQKNVPVQVLGLSSVAAISAGGNASFALRADGTVWSWGWNIFGQLGHGDNSNTSMPGQVSGLTDVTAVAASEGDAYALRSDGTVRDWGYNVFGELGDGTTTARNAPIAVALASVTSLAAGGVTGYALTSAGTVLAWGANNHGQLGNGTSTNSGTPVAVHTLTTVAAVAGSTDTGYALLADGTVWAWGDNGHGQVGDNTTTDRSEPVPVLGLTKVLQVAAGPDATCGYAIIGT
jgi:alpha-tubulin suppressor-like RCC1 family protein